MAPKNILQASGVLASAKASKDGETVYLDFITPDGTLPLATQAISLDQAQAAVLQPTKLTAAVAFSTWEGKLRVRAEALQFEPLVAPAPAPAK